MTGRTTLWRGESVTARALLLRGAATLAAAVLLQPGPGAAQEAPGNSDPCAGIPNCELQQQAPVTYNRDESRGWAYYCSGDHPYYWGEHFAGLGGRWVQTNRCFTTTEDPAAENTPNKLDVNVTNDAACGQQDYTISLACSPNPPPYYAPACYSRTPGATIFTDPKCPIQGNIQDTCAPPSPVISCIQNWVEQCPNNIQYWCTQDPILQLTECSACTD